jgi:hypothetical protein
MYLRQERERESAQKRHDSIKPLSRPLIHLQPRTSCVSQRIHHGIFGPSLFLRRIFNLAGSWKVIYPNWSLFSLRCFLLRHSPAIFLLLDSRRLENYTHLVANFEVHITMLIDSVCRLEITAHLAESCELLHTIWNTHYGTQNSFRELWEKFVQGGSYFSTDSHVHIFKACYREKTFDVNYGGTSDIKQPN